MTPLNNNIERHPWMPFIPNDAKILILGTFPPKSNKWSMEFYYPNFINDFWRIMGFIFYNDKNTFIKNSLKQFKLDEIKTFLNEKHIAIGDSALEVKRLKGNASDKFLEIITPLPLLNILEDFPNLQAIASTGEKAAQVIAQLTDTHIPNMGNNIKTSIYGKEIKIFRMPSTSRAYPLSMEKKAEFYKELFLNLEIL